jgi:hypothetical protein
MKSNGRLVMNKTSCCTALLAIPLVLAIAGCGNSPSSGHVLDEALQAGRDSKSFPAADEDYFHDMDGGVALSPDEVKGRNTWIVWTGGNDRFWDVISVSSFGSFDLLKTISSNPNLKFKRSNRFETLGLINEPCFDEPTGPDSQRHGLWLDKQRPGCGPDDPFANATKYPGVAIGARGKNVPIGSYYGEPTGIIGLRLFPNPKFDAAAEKNWDAKRYYDDPKYYLSKDLVKPYRVGMSCGFCHVGPNPVNPPSDPENPKWENLSSNVGAQYFWVDRIWSWDANPENFIYQLLHTARPGSLDTSLVSTDYINNPRTMNAIYNVIPRLGMAKRWGKETLAGGDLDNSQFNDFPGSGLPQDLFEKPATVWTPHVLKDGSDSVGPLAALNRVYLNIGLFSEEWLLHFIPLSGGKRTTPIEIAVAKKNSSYWNATVSQTPDLTKFLIKASAPQYLHEAPRGDAYLSKDQDILNKGKGVFAERCARCHSSKLPDPPVPGMDPTGCAGPGYLDCWNRYWQWTKSDDFKQKMRAIVMKDDFLKDNYLSADFRVPVTLLQTNACSPLATNAIEGNIWDNFSSQSYKSLPSVGEIVYYDPFTGEPQLYKMPGGGLGYTRPASLVSLWSTAPFLLNNSVGKFDPSPSVDDRMKSFQDSIEKMLWPEKRDKDPKFGDKIPGVIDRTDSQSYFSAPVGYLSPFLQRHLGTLTSYFPWLFSSDGIKIGPIPKGTPVDLIANLELRSESPRFSERFSHDIKMIKLLPKVVRALKSMHNGAGGGDVSKALEELQRPMFELDKCPDFIVNRGHYFGTDYFKEPPGLHTGYFENEPGLSDDDKRALIEFLKTF